MRFLKQLLCGIYGYLALFGAACFIAWAVRGDEPTALIAGICGAAGIESIVGALMKVRELETEQKNRSDTDRKER